MVVIRVQQMLILSLNGTGAEDCGNKGSVFNTHCSQFKVEHIHIFKR